MDFSAIEQSHGNEPVLNLKKNDVLDLTKTDSSLKHLILGAGWDVPETGSSYDLDIAAFLLGENGRVNNPQTDVVFFNNMKQQGICLNGDNRTGAGDGDDEQITIHTDELHPSVSRIVFVVTIYDAITKKQMFGKVKNAYVRLLDMEQNERVLCRYPLTDDYSTETAMVFAEIEKTAGGWTFKAIGEGCHGDLNTLLSKYM